MKVYKGEFMMQKFIVTSAVVVLNDQNRILLKQDPKRGWELPGGQVEQNETIKNACVREVKEETGIDIEIKKFCGVSHKIQNNICNMWWLAKPTSDCFQTGVESLAVGYFDLNRALELIQNDNFKVKLLKCLETGEQPFFISF